MKYYIVGAIVAIAIFGAGYYFRGRGDPQIIESVRVDTLRVSIPTLLEVAPKIDDVGERVTIIDQLPIVEVIENDTPEVIRVVDTLWAEVPISLHVFGGESWHAEVSGYGVTMESMEIYNTTTTRSVVELPTWEVSAIAGVDPYTQWVGGSATRRWGRFRASVDVGYDFKNSMPYIRASGGITLFSK